LFRFKQKEKKKEREKNTNDVRRRRFFFVEITYGIAQLICFFRLIFMTYS